MRHFKRDPLFLAGRIPNSLCDCQALRTIRMVDNEGLEMVEETEKEMTKAFGSRLSMRFGEKEDDDSSSTSGSSGSDSDGE